MTAPGPRRWALLGAFCLLVVTTQLLWLTFAPVTAVTARTLGVSEGLVGDLAVVSPLLFVLLAVPAGRLIDRSFRFALTLGAALTLAGALLRLADTGSYGWLLAGQVVAAVGQPFVLNATTTLAARFFPPANRAHAIAAGSAAQFLGVLLAAAGGAGVVAAAGLRGLLLIQAAVAAAAFAGVAGLLHVVRPAPAERSAPVSRAWLRHDPLIWRLAFLLFVGVGVFNALATWLDPIMAGFGHDGAGGPLIAVTTVAGVLGAAVLPGPAAARGRRRAVLLTATVVAVTVTALLTVITTPPAAGVLLAVLGFVVLAGLPVALEWSETHVGAARSGLATGVILMAGNLGGVVLVLLVQPFVGDPALALAVIALAGLPGAVVAFSLPRTAAPGPRVPRARASPVAGATAPRPLDGGH